MLPGNILIGDTNDSNIGLLDTRGTFGSNNKNPFNTTAPAFARINQDILAVPIGNKLTNNQTTLFTRVTYAGSGNGSVTSQSIQVDINSPAYVTDSIYINGNRQLGASPNSGFSVPNIAPSTTTTITFSVKVQC